MAYRIKFDRPLGEELGRIVAAQANKLKPALATAGPQRSAAGGPIVHEARKAGKKIRAVLRLAMPDAGEAQATFEAAEAVVRLAGRALSGQRDRDVRLQSIELLADALPTRVRSRLLAEARKSPATPADDWAEAPTADAIDAVLEAIDCSAVSIDDVLDGMIRTYKRAGKALARIEAADDPEAFHTLRRHLQRHGRHMQLLEGLWPDEMRMRYTVCRRATEALGTDHDLAVLAQWAAEGRTTGLADIAETVAAACSERSAALRGPAVAEARLLLAERPRALRQRMLAYAKRRD